MFQGPFQSGHMALKAFEHVAVSSLSGVYTKPDFHSLAMLLGKKGNQ